MESTGSQSARPGRSPGQRSQSSGSQIARQRGRPGNRSQPNGRHTARPRRRPGHRSQSTGRHTARQRRRQPCRVSVVDRGQTVPAGSHPRAGNLHPVDGLCPSTPMNESLAPRGALQGRVSRCRASRGGRQTPTAPLLAAQSAAPLCAGGENTPTICIRRFAPKTCVTFHFRLLTSHFSFVNHHFALFTFH